MIATVLFTFLQAVSVLPLAAATIDAAAFAPNDIIERDVVIIGGGAAGAHAAVKLRQEYGKTVLVIEKEDMLVRLQGPNPARGGETGGVLTGPFARVAT